MRPTRRIGRALPPRLCRPTNKEACSRPLSCEASTACRFAEARERPMMLRCETFPCTRDHAVQSSAHMATPFVCCCRRIGASAMPMAGSDLPAAVEGGQQFGLGVRLRKKSYGEPREEGANPSGHGGCGGAVRKASAPAGVPLPVQRKRVPGHAAPHPVRFANRPRIKSGAGSLPQERERWYWRAHD
jgi:hypothetical protein